MRNTLLGIVFLPLASVCAQLPNMQVHQKGGSISSFSLQGMSITIKFTATGVGNAGAGRSVINAFKLLQNYPNPFNPETSIEYQLPKAGPVEVNVYDMNGRVVRSLVSEQKHAGRQQAQWDSRDNNGKSVASGVYFYQVIFDNSMLAKKMILLK